MRSRVGVVIEKGLADWQIVQQVDGKADFHIAGYYHLPELPEEIGVKVYARVVREDTGEPVVNWMECTISNGTAWEIILDGILAGGPYRIETTLDVPDYQKDRLYTRGDMIHHIGVGDIFVIAGQSNASGRGREPVYDPPETGVHLLRNSGKWDLASHPLNDTTCTIHEANMENSNPGHSPFLCFAKTLKRELGYPIGLIQASLGGSGLRLWNPDEKGTLYKNMINIIRSSGGKVRGILWYQGCTDAIEMEGETYLARFISMVKCVRKDLAAEALPFLTVQLNRCTLPSNESLDRSWGMVREAQRQAARQLENVYVVPAVDCTLSDFIHNSSSANMVIGERLAKAALAELYGRSTRWNAPDIARALKSEENALILEFRNIANWLNLFDVDAGELPFTVIDEKGKIAIVDYSIIDKTGLLLGLERDITGEASIHGSSEMNPKFLVPTDCSSLPMLSFYEVKIE